MLTRSVLPAVLLSGAVAFSSPPRDNLTGLVFDESTGAPLPGTVVLLSDEGRRTTTDTSGSFRFDRLAAGRYLLCFHRLGYADAERLVTVPAEGVNAVQISLSASVFCADEVFVRSTRIVAAESEGPYAVAVSTGDRLALFPAVTLPEMLKNTPGVSFLRDGSWETSLAIRGLGQADLVTLVDDTRIETSTDIACPLSLIATGDIERVETIRTPGSVLFGSGALGGVVHIITRRASLGDEPGVGAEWNTEASSVAGSLAHFVSVAGSTGRVGARVSGSRRTGEDVETPEGRLPNSAFSDFNLNGSAAIRTLGEQTLIVEYQRSQAEQTGIPGGAPIAAAATAKYLLARRELVKLEYDIPRVAPAVSLLTVQCAYQEIDRNVEIIQSPLLTLTPHATHAYACARVESRIEPAADDHMVVGIEFWRRRLDSRRERIDAANRLVVSERPVPLSTCADGGAYLQNEWSVDGGKLSVTAGGRCDLMRTGNDEAWSGSRLLWSAANISTVSWSMQGGIRYACSEMCNASLMLATAFRSPSLEERYQYIDLGNLVRLGNPRLLPERAVALNAGFSGHGGGWTLSADLFVNQLRDLVVDVPGLFDGRPAYVKTNIGTARLYGYEFSAERLLTPWAAVRASAAFVRGEDLHNKANLPRIPPLNGSLEIVGRAPRAGVATVRCSFAAPQNCCAAGEPSTPGYATVDLGIVGAPLEFSAASLTVRAGVQNVFNHAYRNHLSTLRGSVTCEPGRNFYCSVSVDV